MDKVDLKLVPREVETFNEDKNRARITELRRQLMLACVRYIKGSFDGSPQDRLRLASDLSGIPTNLIEVEVKK